MSDQNGRPCPECHSVNCDGARHAPVDQRQEAEKMGDAREWYPVSAFPQGPGWPRQIERCEHPGCAYWKNHTCEHRPKRCERYSTPCIFPAGHGGEFCGAPPEFKIPKVGDARERLMAELPMIRDQIRLARSVALDQAADLVMRAGHNAAHGDVARCLREVEAKIREMK